MAMSKNKRKKNVMAEQKSVVPIKKTAPAKVKEKMPKNKILLIFVCIFLSVVIITGITVATVIAVRNANSVMEYNGTRMSPGVANYFASYAKSLYLGQYSDTLTADEEIFLSTVKVGKTTYGEDMEEFVNEYLRRIVAGCYIYDANASLSKEEEKEIEEYLKARLMNFAEGSEEKFNELTAEFGFDYDDFCEAAVMKYKMDMAQHELFGLNGANLVSDTESSDIYYESNYKRIRLLMIRTVNDFVVVDGVRVKENGVEKMESLNHSEITERLADIETLKNAIKGIEDGSDTQMSFTAFMGMFDKYSATNMAFERDGEYYSHSSEYYTSAREHMPEIALKAMQLSVGEYAFVDFKDKPTDADYAGVCFIYCDELEPGAYTDTSEDGFFSDFYLNMSGYAYSVLLASHAEAVQINPRFYEIDLVRLKKNGTIVIGF